MSDDKFTYLKDYKEPDYWVKHVDLTFDIQDGQTYVTAKLNVKKNGEHNNPLVLDGEELELLAVKVDDSEISKGTSLADGYVTDEKSLSLQPANNEFTLETKVRIHPEKNEALEGLYKPADPAPWCTQCEAEGFRRITYYLDRPDNMATFKTTIIGDKQKSPVLLSNGNLTDEGETPDGRPYTVWEDPFPKPSYLFAVVGGQLDFIEDHFITMSGRDVTLRIYAEEKDLGQLDFAMDSLKRSMRWDEEVYGREYDLDLFNIVAVDSFNMGAMENKSLNVFNTSCLLAHPDTATDADYASVEGVVAHEYFHNWTGNRVTCRDWYQLCLKEGLTVFRDQEFSADMNSRAVCRIGDVRILRAYQFREDAGPTAHPPRPDKFETIDNFYTSTVYEKGGELNRMLRSLLGEDDFRKATDLYFERHDGQAVTVEDWVQCMAEASGRDMDQFMRWYTQAGTPKVRTSWLYVKDSQNLSLTFEQDVPKIDDKSDGQPRHIPIRYGIVSPDGNDIAEGLFELTEQGDTLVIPNVPEGSVPSLLRGFSAPVNLEAPYSDDDLLHLMAHDSDGFNQWEAGSRLLLGRMLEQIDNYEAGKPIVVDPKIIDAFRTILGRADMDEELKALALTLPTYNEISLKRTTIDPQAIMAVKKAFAETLGHTLISEWQAVYHDNYAPEAPYDQKDAGKRRLQNLALGYMIQAQERQGFYNSFWQFARANNMTDKYEALGNIVFHGEAISKANALKMFYDEYKNTPLVIDKWVRAQVLNTKDKAAEVVKKLAGHECFVKPTPNRMAALYGSFIATPLSFHAEDGSGYKLLADFIIDLDGKNAQKAARFVEAFSEYKRYKPVLKNQMETQLKRIASRPVLSPNLEENLRSFLGKAEFDTIRNQVTTVTAPNAAP